MLALRPFAGRILVEIREKYTHVATTAQKYDTKTSGTVAAVSDDDDFEYEDLIGKLVFWEEYKDGAVIERDGKKYAFIKIDDLDGYENVESN